MTAGHKRTHNGTTQRAAPAIEALMIVGQPISHRIAANDNPVPLSLRLRRLWVLVGALAAFGTLAAITFS